MKTKQLFLTVLLVALSTARLSAYTVYYHNTNNYKYAVWSWDSGIASEWSEWMTPVDGHDGWYQTSIRDICSKVIFVSFDISLETPNWSYKKYQTADLTCDGINAYYVEGSGWQADFTANSEPTPVIGITGIFTIDDIEYNLNGTNLTAEVISSNYSGDIVIPSSVTYESITYSVTSIGDGAFFNCTSLTMVTIPESVISIGLDAFYNCPNLTAVHISNITAWCAIEFGNSLANPLCYAKHLYLNGAEVTELVVPDGVLSICQYAFNNCYSLTLVAIPNSVTSIGKEAFYQCTGLTNITIGNSVTSIGDYAFSGCSGLKAIYNFANMPPEISDKVFNGTYTSILYVPDESVETYANALWWDEFTIIRPASDLRLVTFVDWNERVLSKQYVYNGENAVIPANPQREGYIFEGWDKEITNITEDLIVTALYTLGHSESNPTSATTNNDIVGTCYTISGAYNAGPGVIQCGEMPNKGVRLKLNQNSIISPDKANAIDIQVHEGYAIKSFSLIGVTNTNGGIASLKELYVDGVKYTSVFNGTIPARDGNVASRIDISGINAQTSIVLIFDLGWDGVTQANMCYTLNYVNTNGLSVRFNDWDGTKLLEQFVEDGSAAIAPEDPTREGYTFIGWDKDFSNITEDLVVTAQYKINRFYVQFLDWDNTILKADSVDWNTDAIAPANPSREGYDFLGWDKAFGSVTSDLVINAQYEYGRTTNYSMTFINGQNSEEIFDEIVSIKVPAAPAITGFTFLKWEIVSGDLADGFVIQAVYTANTPTEAPAVYTNPTNPAQKLIRNGNVYILTDDKTYTVTGQEVK